jgi:hypothetical protein
MEAGNTSQIEHKGVAGGGAWEALGWKSEDGGYFQSPKVLEAWSRNSVNIFKYL